MCGIVGYLGNRNTIDIVIKGLKRLEYRGYDSAGISFFKDGKIELIKKKGKVDGLENEINRKNKYSPQKIAIGHTRWATHGEPNDINAHPHKSNDGSLIIAHNGIIENYGVLKKELLKEGFVFKSETDTEILVNFIQLIKNKEDLFWQQT